MQRIAIVGPPGSGKTTLARERSERTGIEVVNLDRSFFAPGWGEMRSDEWRATHQRLLDHEAWIMDGTYANTIDDRLAMADTVITLEFTRGRCLVRVLGRILRHYGQDVQAPGCPEKLSLEFLRYVWRFPIDHQHEIDVAIERHRSNLTVVRLASNAQRRHFLANL